MIFRSNLGSQILILVSRAWISLFFAYHFGQSEARAELTFYFHEHDNHRNEVYNILNRLASLSAHREVRSWAANEPEVIKPSKFEDFSSRFRISGSDFAWMSTCLPTISIGPRLVRKVFFIFMSSTTTEMEFITF